MSSPIIHLGQSWSGVPGGLAVSMQYDAATRTVHGTVQNTLSRKLCYVQAEPHLKSGTRTVGELGPEKLGHLDPGQEATSSLAVAGEPELAGVSYDGYVVHMEVFDCTGPGPSAPTAGEGAEGDGEHGGGEGNGEQGSGAEDSHESDEADGEEGSGANALSPDESLDEVRSGAWLSLGYDAPSNSFKGTVENTTRRRPGPGQGRGSPLERDGTRPHGSDQRRPRGDADDQPACDGGVLHGVDSTRRGRRGSRVRR